MGGYSDAIAAARRLLTEHPHREHLHGQLILALYRSGRTAEALAGYQQVRTMLADELGVEPGLALQRLHQQVLRHDPALTPGGGRASAATPAQLPAAVPDFVGRAAQAEHVTAQLNTSGETDSAPMPARICVVCGPGGIGKTTFALHVAHRLRHQFPDGVLFASLRGPGAQSADPADVLGMFLRTLGAEARIVPGELEARAALVRSMMAGRRFLIVLDDACSSAQVRPLLPAPGSAVLVTSRSRLSGLAGADVTELPVLTEQEALQLFAAVAGTGRTEAEPGAAGEVVAACGHLPLAIRISGARLAAREAWSVADLAGRLTDGHHLLDELRIDDADVRASFTLSYTAMDAAAARAFRLIALLDTPAIGLDVAAALLDMSPHDTEQMLEKLVDAHLVTSPSRQTYTFHDLVRLFARERALACDADTDRTAALTRAIRALTAQLRRAVARSQRRQAPAGRVAVKKAGVVTAEDPGWLGAERASLLGCITQVHSTPGLPAELAAGLLESMHDALIIGGHWTDLDRCGVAVVAAARRDNDPRSEAGGCRAIGRVATYRHDFPLALQMLDRAVLLARQSGDVAGEAGAHMSLGPLHGLRGDHQAAITHLTTAVEMYTELGIDHLAATAHNYLGQQYLAVGHPDSARDQLVRGLTLARRATNGSVESMALYLLSAAYSASGEHDTAIAYSRDGVIAARAHNARYSEARAVSHLGRALLAAGRGRQAQQELILAAELFDQIGDQHSAAARRADAIAAIPLAGFSGASAAYSPTFCALTIFQPPSNRCHVVSSSSWSLSLA